MNRFSTSPSDRSRFPLLRPLGAALVLVAGLALGFVLFAALAMGLFLGWPAGTAPDLYSQGMSEPSIASKAAALPDLLFGAGQGARNRSIPRMARDAELLSPARPRRPQTAASER